MIIQSLVRLYTFAIFGRIVMSYFPIAPGGPMATVFSVLYSITEPVLGPLRRVIPPVGMFDLSPLVAIVVLQLVASSIHV